MGVSSVYPRKSDWVCRFPPPGGLVIVPSVPEKGPSPKRVLQINLQTSPTADFVGGSSLRPLISPIPLRCINGTLSEMPLKNIKVCLSWQKFQRGEVAAVIVPVIGRFNRVVAVDVPHHVTQRVRDLPASLHVEGGEPFDHRVDLLRDLKRQEMP